MNHSLASEKKARAKAEKQAEKKSNSLTELEGKYQSAQESLLELEQDTGMKSSVNERELNRQLEKMTHQYNQQVTVNKTLSSKLMIQEKAYIDEKRAKIDLEKRLNVMM